MSQKATLPRILFVALGSDNDLKRQCSAGLEVLIQETRFGSVDVRDVLTASIHRMHHELCELLKTWHESGETFVIIAGAGWAAHLPGMIDAILGYDHRNARIYVIGVAFEDRKNERHTKAAELSISEVPNTRVIYGDSQGNFVGPLGFHRACIYASTGTLPKLKVPEKEYKIVHRSLLEAYDYSLTGLNEPL
jgi:phosphoribosylcarboxyaminoimidazole (NCAIR) mutase